MALNNIINQPIVGRVVLIERTQRDCLVDDCVLPLTVHAVKLWMGPGTDDVGYVHATIDGQRLFELFNGRTVSVTYDEREHHGQSYRRATFRGTPYRNVWDRLVDYVAGEDPTVTMKSHDFVQDDDSIHRACEHQSQRRPRDDASP